MKLALCSAVFGLVALAQVPKPPPPPTPTAAPAASPTAPAAAGATIAPKKPTCEEARGKRGYNIYFKKVDIEELTQTVSDVTCKTFILPENIRGKISIVGPENGKVEVNADQFYAAFLAALDSNSLAVYPHGKFLKIVDKQRAKQFPIPTVTDPDEPYTLNEQMVTRLFRVKNVEIEQLRGVLQQLVTPSGDTIPFQPDTIIVNDLGSNMHRLEKIVDQLDTRAAGDEMRVLQIRYATSQEIADKITKLFESKAAKPGQRPGAIAPPPPPPSTPGQPPPAGDAVAGGPATLSQLIPDERTNKLIVIASPAAMERIAGLIREIDIPVSGEGRINVYYLENANAEDLASTLQTLAQGTANRKGPPPPPPPPGSPRVTTAAELFSGEVKVSADKPTNSLVIIASQNDYRSLVRVIEKLDVPRRQVFVEAVIMEVNLDRKSELGINLHGGVPLSTAQGTAPVFFGTKYNTQAPLPPSLSLTSLASLGGFLAGLQGPAIPNLTLGGIPIPQFGIVLNALQTSSDVNILSTPHILTTDNEEAEISVGEKVPFPSGFSANPLSGFQGAAQQPGLQGLQGLLGGLGGGGGLPFNIRPEDVLLKLTIKPQINDSDLIRMVISEQIEEIARVDPVLGPTTSKRGAKTTIIAKNQQTVVIGGIMQDRMTEGVRKIPILGDLPILGHLFRTQERRKIKTNLLLFLTPYIIRDGSDFARIFERKLKERQQFVEQFYGATTAYDIAIDYAHKPGPLGRMGQVLIKESQKVEHGGPGSPGERVITPSGTSPRPGAPPPGPGAPSGANEPEGIDLSAPKAADSPPPPPPVREQNIERLKVQPELQ